MCIKIRSVARPVRFPSLGTLAVSGVAPRPVSRINGNLGQNQGRSPFASSTHTGVVSVAFCDGRVKALSASIDFKVYAGLFTLRNALRSAGDQRRRVLGSRSRASR